MELLEEVKNRPIIFHYLSYGDYFLDLKNYLERKGIDVSFTALGRALALNSRTKVRRLFKGQIPLSKAVMEQLAKVFEMTESELNFLDLLRRYSQAKDADTAVALYKKILLEKRKHCDGDKFFLLEEAQFSILEEWYYIPVLHYFDLKDAKPDVLSIVKAFKGKLTLDEVQASLRKLCDLNLITYLPDGTMQKNKDHLALLDSLPRTLVKKYHEMMLKKARESIFGLPQDKRVLLTATVGTTQEGFLHLRKELTDYLVKLSKEYAVESADSLYQINIQAFNFLTISKEETTRPSQMNSETREASL